MILISAFSIAVKALAFVLVLGLAGRVALRLAFRERASDPALAVAAGGLLLYLVLMVVGKVAVAAGIMFVFAVIGAALVVRGPRAGGSATWWERLLIALLVTVTLADPIFEWDARSIWFYHAKVIFHEGLDAQAWRYLALEVPWSQPAYPELLPALAGTAAWLFGYWNDYLPKLGLVCITAPAMLLGGRLFGDWRGRALFWGLALAATRKYAYVGYMDGPLALWSMVALLYVVAGVAGAVPAHRASAVAAVALAICVGLKAEGGVIAAAFGAGLLAGYLLQPRAERASLLAYVRPAAVVVLPWLAWRAFCQLAEMPPGWATLSGDYLARAAKRLGDMAAFSEILREMFRTTIIATIVALAALLVWLRHAGAWWRRACIVGVLILALYCGALLLVYLGTPFDLQVQLRTSVARTVLPLRAWILALLLAGYMVWRGTWRPAAAR